MGQWAGLIEPPKLGDWLQAWYQRHIPTVLAFRLVFLVADRPEGGCAKGTPSKNCNVVRKRKWSEMWRTAQGPASQLLYTAVGGLIVV